MRKDKTPYYASIYELSAKKALKVKGLSVLKAIGPTVKVILEFINRYCKHILTRIYTKSELKFTLPE
jgi:hypothetical protein